MSDDKQSSETEGREPIPAVLPGLKTPEVRLAFLQFMFFRMDARRKKDI